jgi:hypothetical protein
MPRLPAVAMVLAVAAASPAGAQAPDGEGRCWVAVRVTGPAAMRVSQDEAEARLRERCRPGDALVILSDTGQPFGPVIALYCDMSRAFLVERAAEFRSAEAAHDPALAPVGLLTCTYRGSRRADR